jgi:hypothetical protein
MRGLPGFYDVPDGTGEMVVCFMQCFLSPDMGALVEKQCLRDVADGTWLNSRSFHAISSSTKRVKI